MVEEAIRGKKMTEERLKAKILEYLEIQNRKTEPRTIEQLRSDLNMWKGELEHSYRKEHKIAPSWLYEKIHRLEEQIR